MCVCDVSEAVRLVSCKIQYSPSGPIFLFVPELNQLGGSLYLQPKLANIKREGEKMVNEKIASSD